MTPIKNISTLKQIVINFITEKIENALTEIPQHIK